MTGVFPQAECLRDFRTPNWPPWHIHSFLLDKQQFLSRGKLISNLSYSSWNSLCLAWREYHRFSVFIWIISVWSVKKNNLPVCRSSLSHLKHVKSVDLHYCCMSSALNGNVLSLWLASCLVLASTPQLSCYAAWLSVNVTWNTSVTKLRHSHCMKISIRRSDPTLRTNCSVL